MIAVRRAFTLVPIEAINAVTQVPIFEPRTRNKAFPIVNAPEPTIVMNTPVAAEELCINAVKVNPQTIKSKGKSIAAKIFENILTIF